ncbi:MAG: hypothetical protein ACLTOX_03760 [Streptococcus thermophilus]
MVTATVGASTDQDKPVKVAVDVEFYDKDGKMFNPSERNAIVALTHLTTGTVQLMLKHLSAHVHL